MVEWNRARRLLKVAAGIERSNVQEFGLPIELAAGGVSSTARGRIGS
jgi:hypothetical protein